MPPVPGSLPGSKGRPGGVFARKGVEYMGSVSETYRVADVASFNPNKGFGFCIGDKGARFFFHANQYNEASFSKGSKRPPALSKAKPHDAPGEGTKIVFWDVKKAQLGDEREPAVGGWALLTRDWEEFLEYSRALEEGSGAK